MGKENSDNTKYNSDYKIHAENIMQTTENTIRINALIDVLTEKNIVSMDELEKKYEELHEKDFDRMVQEMIIEKTS